MQLKEIHLGTFLWQIPILCVGALLIQSQSVDARGAVQTPPLSTRATLAAVPEEFVCGTYRGNQLESHWFQFLHQSMQEKVDKGTVEPQTSAASFIYDDVWVVEDDGTLSISGNNSFDTDFRTFSFAPNLSGGYDVSEIPVAYDSVLGNDLLMGDDTNVTVALGFMLSYYATPWDSVHVNANGIVSFGADVNPSGGFTHNDFYSSIPKIAPYFMDLDPSSSGSVLHKNEPTKTTITWAAVPEFGTANVNTLQLVLHDSGVIHFTFNGIQSTLPPGARPITSGVHPGVALALESVSYSDSLPYAGQQGTAVFEQYMNLVNPLVNEVTLLQRFYQNFPDEFFQIIFFTNFPQTMGGFANELNIKNQVSGIGLDIFDNSAIYGSAGTLESRCNMSRLGAWPDKAGKGFLGFAQNSFLTIMAQETGHRWGSFINFQDSTGAASNMILGRSDAHWSYYLDSDHSCLEGGNWTQLTSPILFVTPTNIDFYFDIDEYLFGLRRPEEVSPTFYLSSPTNDLPQNRAAGSPWAGVLTFGTPVDVTIQDVIAAEGPRIPSADVENKDLRQAFIFLLQNGTSATQAQLDKIALFRRDWEDYFESSVDGRITCNTSLTTSFPIGVLQGTVRDNSTLQPVADFTAINADREFVQNVAAGGRYTFRQMADSTSGVVENLIITFEAPGYLADTLLVNVPFGSTIARDILLSPIVATDIDEGEVARPHVLYQNSPNPFNPLTTIRYDLVSEGPVELTVYDSRGRVIRHLVNKVQMPGSNQVIWEGTDDQKRRVASGVYFYRLKADGFLQMRKMLLAK